jgi:hypothetical protein
MTIQRPQRHYDIIHRLGPHGCFPSCRLFSKAGKPPTTTKFTFEAHTQCLEVNFTHRGHFLFIRRNLASDKTKNTATTAQATWSVFTSPVTAVSAITEDMV